MAIGKEYLRPLEELAKQQQRIFNDSMDYGVFATPQITQTIRAAMQGLKELEGIKVSRWSTGVSCKTRLGFEIEEGRVQGVEIEVALHTLSRSKSFYSIDIERASWEMSK